jgi:hypothetical protein
MSAADCAPPPVETRTRRSRVAFLLRKFVTGYPAPGAPHLDALALAHFGEVLARTTHYLEYGSGGSTVAAWRIAQTVVSVDNDRRFLRTVARAVADIAPPPALSSLMHVDTGITKQWGYPLFRRPVPRRLRRWQRYPVAPWAFLETHGVQPDTILVDGRFRVACVLESLLRLDEGSPCTILVDDYADRPEYAAVEEFAALGSMHGLMAVLRKRTDFDRARCLRVLPQFQRDWR